MEVAAAYATVVRKKKVNSPGKSFVNNPLVILKTFSLKKKRGLLFPLLFPAVGDVDVDFDGDV